MAAATLPREPPQGSLLGRFMASAKAQVPDLLAKGGATIDKQLLARHIREQGWSSGDVTVAGVQLRLEPLAPSIGTVVHGVDLTALTPEMRAFLQELWLRRKVLFFRGQSHLTRQQHVDLAEQFGTLGTHFGERDWEPHNKYLTTEESTPEGFPDVLYIYSDENTRYAAAEWHSDVMWSTRPPMGSILLAREVPHVGGDTCFCDMYAMWEGLRPSTRQRLQSLNALNVGLPVHARGGVAPQAEHPCARTHPETGCTGLYIAPNFTRKIVGVSSEESKELLAECFAQAGRPEYSCRFRWEEGSVAFWDNRSCQHYATPDSWPHTRRLERVTVLDRDESKKVPYFAGVRAKL